MQYFDIFTKEKYEFNFILGNVIKIKISNGTSFTHTEKYTKYKYIYIYCLKIL